LVLGLTAYLSGHLLKLGNQAPRTASDWDKVRDADPKGVSAIQALSPLGLSTDTDLLVRFERYALLVAQEGAGAAVSDVP
jgi:hypothetical protein